MKVKLAACAVVLALIGLALSLTGGPGASSRTTSSAGSPSGRYWLESHQLFVPHQGAGRPRRPAVNVYAVARTLLGLEGVPPGALPGTPEFARSSAVLVEHACSYIFGGSARISRVLHVHGYRFHPQTSGPNASPLRPGGTDHRGYALQCSYSPDVRGSRLLDLQVSSGGLSLRNLTTYLRTRAHGVTGEITYSSRPPGLVHRGAARAYVQRRLSRASYPDA